MSKLRIRLAPHYHRVLPDLLWTIAVNDIPNVAAALGPISRQ